ncbi:CBS domain protein [Kribbella amoyensis]|uniref:CBS domain protein n=1 Tax=Kribbella amoyensis TaxID=996641 RepID=A0A561AZJ3_9ACTN|nr:CBS domain-containing protein [Kribbella amoyensis]TWD72030.1 CBS domain protein [Kribbella amoyensis]
MLIRDLMTSPAITVTSDMPLGTALRILDDRKITAMPVLDQAGTLVGIVGEADLVPDEALLDDKVPISALRRVTDAPARRVADVMNHLVATVQADDELDSAVDLMWSTMVKSLPVVDHGKVVGMISRSDVVHLLAGRDDRIQAEVRELVETECADWLVTVQDGIVTVTGPADAHQRRVAEVLAHTVQGVVAVRIA